MAKIDQSRIFILAVAVIGYLMPPVFGQSPYEDLQHARDALMAKEQRLQQIHEKTRADIDRLISRLTAQLETSQQLLDAIDTRLDQTKSAIRTVSDALKGM